MAYAGQINYNPAGILSQFKNPAEEAGKFFQNYSNQIRQDEAAKELAKQREQAQKNADRAFSLQGLQETRAAQEYAQKQATTEANAKASTYIDAARQDMLTPTQNAALLAAYNKNPKVNIKALQDKMVAKYNASPTLQKQGLATVNIEPTAVQKEVQTINPTTGEVEMKLMNVVPDMTSALHKKDTLLSGLDTQIAHKEDMDQKEKLTKMQIAADRANTRDKISAQMTLEGAKDTPVEMFKKLPDGSVQEIKVPISQAVRYQNEKGFSLGKLSNVNGTKSATDGSGEAKLDLLKIGGRGWLGGTSGINLVQRARAAKAANPHIPMSVIEAEIANIVDNQWFTDTVSKEDLETALSKYPKTKQ